LKNYNVTQAMKSQAERIAIAYEQSSMAAKAVFKISLRVGLKTFGVLGFFMTISTIANASPSERSNVIAKEALNWATITAGTRVGATVGGTIGGPIGGIIGGILGGVGTGLISMLPGLAGAYNGPITIMDNTYVKRPPKNSPCPCVPLRF